MKATVTFDVVVEEIELFKDNLDFFTEEVDGIFQELEGSVDRFYDNMEKKQKKQPVAEWTD